MAWGLFKKLKEAFRKVKEGIKKVITSKPVKAIVNTGIKLAPLIGAGVASAAGAPPTTGMTVGNVVQGVGRSLGLG